MGCDLIESYFLLSAKTLQQGKYLLLYNSVKCGLCVIWYLNCPIDLKKKNTATHLINTDIHWKPLN